MLAARYASIAVSGLSIVIALFAQNMNVAFLVSLAFCVAASANLPVIIYTIYWKDFNTAGAVTGMLAGLLTALVLVILSPNVIAPDGSAMFVGEAIFPLTNPAIISIPAGFLGAYIGARISNKREPKKYRSNIKA